jgi:signal transduction histidine kinase
MTRRVLLLAGGHIAIALAVGLAHTPLDIGPVLPIAGFLLAFALVGIVPMHLELGRHACTVTLVDAVLVAALFNLGTHGVILAAAGGELLALIVSRQRPLKLTYNVAAALSAFTLASHAYALGPSVDPARPASWAWALLAVAVYGFASHTSTSLVLMFVERQPFDAVFRASLTTAAITSVVTGAIGLAAVALQAAHPMGPALLVPLVGLVVIETRRLAAHRAEHLRFERLYLSSRNTGGLQGFDDALATLAREARHLVTGAVGLCCGQDRHGLWTGAIVDDLGYWPAPPDVIAAARAIAADGAAEVPAGRLPAALRAIAPSVASGVVAESGADSVAPAVLVVLREIGGDEGHASRARALGAFAGHAALTIANACLYAEVEDALRHQVDLNRQKDDFVAVVSHELRTPLTALLGSIRTIGRLGDRLAVDARARMLEIAERQGTRLQRLIEDLLLVAAAEDERAVCTVEEVRLGELVTDILTTLSGGGVVANGERVTVQVDPKMAVLLTDGPKLGQLIFNLVENAAKYAPDGPIEVVARLHRGAATIAVVDHGPGIAADDRERAFERFVQLDQSSTRERGGTGLGLYLCRRLARLLGGNLDLADTEGGGCTFTIVLPGSSAAGQPDRAIAARRDRHEDGHMEGTVLIEPSGTS